MTKRFKLKEVFAIKGAAIDYGTGVDSLVFIGPKNSEIYDVLIKKGWKFMGYSRSTPLATGNIDDRHPPYRGLLLGGSSSGVAQDLDRADVDMVVGSDVGGSCRIPPIRHDHFGLAFTNGRFVDGMLPSAGGLESIGVMARSLDVLKLVVDQLVTEEKGWSRVVDLRVQNMPFDWDKVVQLWWTIYLPEFYSNTQVFNGVFHRFSERGFIRKYESNTRPLLTAEIERRRAQGRKIALGRGEGHGDCDILVSQIKKYFQGALIITHAQPESCKKYDTFDDRYLLLANILGQPSLVLPFGARGLQLIGPPGSQRLLVKYGLRIGKDSADGTNPKNPNSA